MTRGMTHGRAAPRQMGCAAEETERDNTGDRAFAERMLFPTVRACVCVRVRVLVCVRAACVRACVRACACARARACMYMCVCVRARACPAEVRVVL